MAGIGQITTSANFVLVDKPGATLDAALAASGPRVSASASVANDEAQRDDPHLRMAVKIFAERVPNAWGETAMRLDEKGLYSAAVNHPAYYLHEANKDLFAHESANVANRVNGIRHVVIMGQGPGSVFLEQEAILLGLLPKLEEVTTIEFSERFNDEAGVVVAALAHKVGRPIKHNKLTESFRDAAANHPDILLTPEKKLVIKSGSTSMNLVSDVPGEFPRKALQDDIRIMKDMAGEEGFVMITYDSFRDDKVPTMLAAYSTDEAREMFLSAVDTLVEKCPQLQGLSRDHFQHVVRWQPESRNVEQMFAVQTQFGLRMDYRGRTYRVHESVGDEFQIINSYKPDVELVTDIAREIDLNTVFSAEHHNGFTLQLMRSTPCSTPRPAIA